MASELLSSKVRINEEAAKLPTVPGTSTSICAAIGITQRGPINQEVISTSFPDWLKTFGHLTSNADLWLAAMSFFENGGKDLRTVRVVHYTDITNAGTKTSAAATVNILNASASPSAAVVTGSISGPYNLEPGDTLLVDLDQAGSPTTVTFLATAGLKNNTGAATYALSNGQTLTLSVNGGPTQSVLFSTGSFVDIGAATPQEVVNVINASIVGAQASLPGSNVVRITSDTRGTGSTVNIIGGTGRTALAYTTGTGTNGTGNVVNIDAVTVTEIKTAVELAVAGVTVTNVGGAVRISTNATGDTRYVQVTAPSTADDELGIDNAVHRGGAGTAVNTLRADAKTDGTYGNNVRLIVADASSGDATEFDLRVEESGIIVERWPNLSMADTAPRYVETILNDLNTGSDLVVLTDLDVTGTQRPANGTYGPMTGGLDGLSDNGSIGDTDYIGSSVTRTGLRALDTDADIRILMAPGRATAALHLAMLSYAETTREMKMICILDPPANQSASQMISYVDDNGLRGLTEFGAIYWPRVGILNPNKSVLGNTDQITVAPSGLVAGMYARLDASKEGGVYEAPAGVGVGRLIGALSVENVAANDEAVRDLVYPKLINPIWKNGVVTVDGCRTLKADGNFPTIGERRGMIFIEQTCKAAMEKRRMRGNTPKSRQEAANEMEIFLRGEMRNDAFASTDPKTAFFVDVGAKLNPASVVRARKMIGRVGVATKSPAEFIVLSFSQDTRALDQELAA